VVQLEKAGVLHGNTGKGWGQVYLAKPILNGLEAKVSGPKDQPLRSALKENVVKLSKRFGLCK